MITNVEFNNPKKGAIRTYARYMMSPKAQGMPYAHSGHTAGNERLEAVYCNGLTQFDAQKGQRSINKSCKLFEEELRTWNKTWKQGQKIKDTSNQCVIGTISFGENDKVNAIDALAKAQECVSNVMPGTRLALFTVHGDSNVFHVHFEVSVVDMETGKAYAPQGEYRAMYNQWELENERMELAYPDQLEHVQQREAVAIQERKAGLETTRSVNVKQLTHKTHQKLFKRGMDIEDVPEADLRSQFTLAYREAGKDFDKLLDNLETRGIQVIPNMGVTSDKISGLTIAFKHDLSIRTGLGKYGDNYKWNTLSKDFNYDNEQHRGRLVECKEQAEALKHGNTRPQITGMDGQDSRASEQLDQRTHTTAAGLGAVEGPTNGTNQRHEEASIRGVETGGNDHDDGSSQDRNQGGLPLTGPVDRSREQHDGITTRLQTNRESLGQLDEVNQASTHSSDERTTQEPHTVELHSGGIIGNTDVVTGLSNPHLATKQGDTQSVVLTDEPPSTGTKSKLQGVIDLCGDPPLTEEELKLAGPRLTDAQLIELAYNVPEPANFMYFESESEKIERVAKALKKAIEEDGPILIPAPSTINGPHIQRETVDERVTRIAIEALGLSHIIK